MSDSANFPSSSLEMIYTNYRGETARRRIVPTGQLRFGTSEWHRTPGWLLEARDLEKDALREFALDDCDFTCGETTAADVPPSPSMSKLGLAYLDESGLKGFMVIIPTGRVVRDEQGRWTLDVVDAEDGEDGSLELGRCRFKR